MNSRTIDVVTEWETVAAPDGYEGLHQLADSEFSGAVSAGTTWAFFLNGRVVGVFEGDIEGFEDAPLTAYRAADPSLPLLFAMQERGGETRAKYYTNETSLSAADKTLENGGFTGYIELSENVLSGDYYVVYHGGKSMSAAFVGSSERLVTGEEAFEKAADEVGIYEVKDVDVELVDIPELPEEEADDADDEAASDVVAADTDVEEDADTDADADADETAEAEPDEDVVSDDVPDADEDEGESESAGDRPTAADDADDGPSADDAGADADGESAGEDDPSTPTPTSAGASAGDPTDTTADSETNDPEAPEPETAAAAAADADAGATIEDPPAPASEPDAGALRDEETDGISGDTGAAARAEPTPEGAAAGDSDGDSVLADEERWREARTIPSLDPSRSNGEASIQGGDTVETQTQTQTQEPPSKRQRRAREARERAAARRERQRGQRLSEGDQGTERLRKRLARARERLDELETERDGLAEERDEYRERVEELEAAREKQRERLDELEAERERLAAEVERLETELESAAESDDTTAGAPAETMAPDRALGGTNLFVRYDRKGEATLEHARDGKASREDVSSNLRLEHHTTFETDGLVVDERPYEEFLRDSTEYSFAAWVVTDLLYEIGETGNRSKLGGVFDAIPDIDRIELAGAVDLAGEEDTERRDFDVIFRDKMGDPLFVADINASRNATTEAMVGSLVENTGTVAERVDSLSAGFYVTESFYEPGALENVAEATGGGLLSRSSKLSYVKLSRKRGYHLCLVEARNGEFHLNVPDL